MVDLDVDSRKVGKSDKEVMLGGSVILPNGQILHVFQQRSRKSRLIVNIRTGRKSRKRVSAGLPFSDAREVWRIEVPEIFFSVRRPDFGKFAYFCRRI